MFMKKNTSLNSLEWLIFDAKNQILGRFASKIAFRLMGKDKISYKSNIANDTRIIIINSKRINISGKKLENKKYYKHSGYPGGLKVILLKDLIIKNPNFVIRNAIKGMLPKNKLQKCFLRHLKIYECDKHPHLAQKPILEQ